MFTGGGGGGGGSGVGIVSEPLHSYVCVLFIYFIIYLFVRWGEGEEKKTKLHVNKFKERGEVGLFARKVKKEKKAED